jgi:6-phosphogluconolactonase
MDIELNQFEDKAAMVAALADEIVLRLKAAIAERGAASLVVSGGGTPKALFAELAGRELQWHAVHITLADERWVAPDSPDSNERLVRETLLTGHAAAARFVPLKTDHSEPGEAETEVEQRLAGMPAPFDVVMLGMGEDGHTASLFPGAEALERGLDRRSGRDAIAITPEPLPSNAPYPRMTLTLPRLLQSRWLVMLLAGESKRDVYEQAINGDDAGEMPVRAVLKQTDVPVATYWAP